ncbi:MAG: type II toxin-antitoxin system VapC family toxin [Syntrophobacteraceae bacterium]
MSCFVIDSSLSAAWCIPDETGEAAETVLQKLGSDEALVPSLWVYEMSNVLVMAERRGRITPADASRAVELIMTLPIRIETADFRVLDASRLLAREYSLSAYDAAYLELAQRQGLPLATMDCKLSLAATRCGVPLL